MPRTPQDRSILIRNVVIGVCISGLIAGAVYLGMRKRGGGTTSDPQTVGSDAAGSLTGAPVAEIQPAEPTQALPVASEASRRWEQLIGTPAVWPADLHGAVDCAEVDRQLVSACRVLDARHANTVSALGGSCELIRDVGRRLAGEPPTRAAEIRSLDATLQNTFHLFRVLGRERIGALLTLMEAEPELVEPMGFALYRWAISRETCAEQETVTIPIERMYDYAGFLFRSLGGQAYLRRRHPEVEAITCFYALQVLDLTIESGHNPQGFDPRREIGRCRSLVQSGSFLFEERYVGLLDSMGSHWKDRGSIAR